MISFRDTDSIRKQVQITPNSSRSTFTIRARWALTHLAVKLGSGPTVREFAPWFLLARVLVIELGRT